MKNAIDRGAYGNRQEDEARLFYTAITRAERLLYLTGSENHPAADPAHGLSGVRAGMGERL